MNSLLKFYVGSFKLLLRKTSFAIQIAKLVLSELSCVNCNFWREHGAGDKTALLMVKASEKSHMVLLSKSRTKVLSASSFQVFYCLLL